MTGEVKWTSTDDAPIDEEARRRFEADWRGGTPHPIETYLPGSEQPLFLATLVELVLIEMEFRWKAKAASGGEIKIPSPDQVHTQPLPIESYVARFPVLGQPAILRQLVQQELRMRIMQRENPDRGDYRRRFPGAEWSDTGLTMADQAIEPAPSAPQIPGYEILWELGRGGMGVVYKARQVALDRAVAIKWILAGTGATQQDVTRFRQEAEAVASLQHANIVQVYDVGQVQGRPYIVLEFVDGGTLARKLGDKPLPPRQAAQYVQTLARAVQAVHQRGILHRDLKPGNVLMAADGTPKITDFGLAKRFESQAAGDGGHGASALTQTGAIMGTPCYMSPEQAAGRSREIGPATDIYALGAILYEMLTGRPPFNGASPTDTIMQVQLQEPVAPRRLQPKVPRDLETIALKCLEKTPARRFATAGDLADDLGRFLDGRVIAARPVSGSERLWRWCRRKPAQAALVAAIFLLMAGTVAGLFVWQGAEYDREQQRLEFKLQKSEDERRHLASQRDAVETFRKLAKTELQNNPVLGPRNCQRAKNFFARAAEVVREPGLDDLRDVVSGELDRAGRLLAFYELSDRAERLAFLENDLAALRHAEKALSRLGVYDNRPAWWLKLPDADLTAEQKRRLQKDVNHHLIVVAGLWGRDGLSATNTEQKQAFRKALEALAMIEDYHQAEKLPVPLTAQVLNVACNLGAGNWFAIKNLQGKEPTSASDCYFVGMACFFVGFSPDSDTAQFLKAVTKLTKLDLGDYKATAMRLLRRAAADEPHHFWSQYWLAWSLEAEGDLRGAEVALTHCIALRPEYGLSYAKRALMLSRQCHNIKNGPTPKAGGDRDSADLEKRAMSDAVRAEQCDPHDWFAHQVRCEAYAWLTRWDEWLNSLGQMLLLLPTEDTPANVRHAEQTIVWRQAEAALNQLSATLPDKAEIWSFKALAAFALNKDQAALEAAAKALESADAMPKLAAPEALAHAVQGAIALGRQETMKALTEFEAALSLKPDTYLAALGRARLREIQEEWSAALGGYEAIEKFAVVDWQRVAAQLGQARALKKLGRASDARQALARAGELDGRAAAAQEAVLFSPPPGQDAAK
jgi:serine/threonine protein kinase/tetratricopeptide (TPR) repeat protein